MFFIYQNGTYFKNPVVPSYPFREIYKTNTDISFGLLSYGLFEPFSIPIVSSFNYGGLYEWRLIRKHSFLLDYLIATHLTIVFFFWNEVVETFVDTRKSRAFLILFDSSNHETQ